MRELGAQKAARIAARHRELAGKRPLFAKKAEDRVALYVYEVIGEDWWTGGGVTAKKVSEALDAAKGAKSLDIYINSEGGDVFEAKAIHTLIRRFDGERVVHVDGIAASAASYIAMAGDRIVTSPLATWMIHEVRGGAYGRAQEMRAMADLMDKENGTMAETYAARTGQKLEDVLGWMNAETWMTAAEATARGFTDEIAEEESEPASTDATAKVAPFVALEAQTRARLAQSVQLARQGQRIQELSGRASPARSARGQP